MRIQIQNSIQKLGWAIHNKGADHPDNSSATHNCGRVRSSIAQQTGLILTNDCIPIHVLLGGLTCNIRITCFQGRLSPVTSNLLQKGVLLCSIALAMHQQVLKLLYDLEKVCLY